jgi:hypothetical protein
VNENEDQLSIVHQNQDTLKRTEDELFRIKVKQDLTMALLHEYIQEWINDALKAIVNPS